MYLDLIKFEIQSNVHAMEVGYVINEYCNKILNQCISSSIMQNIRLLFSPRICNNFRIHMSELYVTMGHVNLLKLLIHDHTLHDHKTNVQST
jgi:large-conductance mechanosensitive channel